MARPRVWLAVLVAGTTLLVVVPATAAAAHDVLRSTTPADGSTLTAAPAQVVMTFDQPALALGTELVVNGPDGTNVADGPAKLVDNTVQQAIAGTLPAGPYTVQWRVTSADGHPISGSFAFTTTQATSRQAHDPAPATTTPAKATSGGGGSAGWIGGLVVVLLVLAVLGWVWWRRRSSPR